MNKELDKAFESLQDNMVKQALIYKDTKLDPFYRFVIGKMDFKECVDKVAKNI